MSILEEIVRNKKKELAAAQKKAPVSTLLSAVRYLDEPLRFANALRTRADLAVIAEIKKASPSAGVICEDFDPVNIAGKYAENDAAAISVLTDETYFSGHTDHLQAVREAVDLPLLRKDFMIDPYQVVEARTCGADAILLIMAVLSRRQCDELVATAREMDLDFLVEAHSFRELERALSEDYGLIGINNRDLSTLTVDLATTGKLMEIVPPEVTVVSESGIKKRADIERLSKYGIDAVLIGETLMRQPDVGKALLEFTGVAKCQR